MSKRKFDPKLADWLTTGEQAIIAHLCAAAFERWCASHGGNGTCLCDLTVEGGESDLRILVIGAGGAGRHELCNGVVAGVSSYSLNQPELTSWNQTPNREAFR